ncbi:NAD(P)H-dependent oxidoreductase [Aquincola sp. MAHUQ-54]|uniref:NAD(P)H-dependent oxidoreductase n=1 Tax=Aquincola agrisoli TaxID=3119538 RepID=A0AAW9QE16_9BURK
MLKVLVMAGSARQGALSGRLAAAGAAVLAAQGAQTTTLDLRALALPIYDGDLEAAHGVPAPAVRLRDAVAGHDALLLVTPEYNGFPTPLFVNAFDWLSRVPADAGGPQGLAATAGKVAAVLSSSPGALGGLRSLNYVRQYLQMAFGMWVVPQQLALGQAAAAFDERGGLKDPRQAQTLERVMQALLQAAPALRAP